MGVNTMSMPSFPAHGADITRDEALTMIVASIAMEESALSHIINAESEKLQYVLGTLPGGPELSASNQEIVEVNNSVTALLNAVMQNQLLLRGKLELAVGAGGHHPEPSCPCEPVCPCEPPCGGDACCQKSAIRLVTRCNGLSWENGSLLAWRCQERQGSAIQWSKENPALVTLIPGKLYGMQYTINVRAPYCGESVGAVSVRLTPRGAFSDPLPLYFPVKGLDRQPMTLHAGALLFPQSSLSSPASLALRLEYACGLIVEQASLDLFEI